MLNSCYLLAGSHSIDLNLHGRHDYHEFPGALKIPCGVLSIFRSELEDFANRIIQTRRRVSCVENTLGIVDQPLVIVRLVVGRN